jgi:hypothetical protein
MNDLGVEHVFMESTEIYWKSVHANLENAEFAVWVVSATQSTVFCPPARQIRLKLNELNRNFT